MTGAETGGETAVAQPQASGKRGGLYYGWVMLPVAVAGAIATSPGQTFSTATFNESLRSSLGLTHSQLSGAYMLGTLAAALPLAYLGLLMDRYGLRKTTAAVIVLLGLACVTAAAAQNLVMLFLAFFLLRLLGPGAMTLLSSNTLAFWFERRLGTVEGARNLGMAAAFAFIPGLNLWLIDSVGWRWAFAFLGLGVCVLMLPLLAFVFRNRPEEVGQLIDGHRTDNRPDRERGHVTAIGHGLTFTETTRTRSFWIILFINALWGLVCTAVTFNIVPIFRAQGLSEQDAAGFLGVLAVSLALTHLAGGMLADRVPLHLLLAVAASCMAGVTYGLDALALPWVAATCGVGMGVAQGLSTGITSVVCVRYFGRSHLGQIRGAFSTATIAASSAGPFLVGLTRDLTGSYGGILTIFTALAAGAFVAALFATAPERSSESGGRFDAITEDVPEVHGPLIEESTA